MTKQLAFYVNVDLCIGCSSCGMACKNQYHQEPGIVWRQLYPLSADLYPHRERAFYSLACNHCEHPCCLEDCPVSAFTKRDDGIVVHNVDACIGCGNCVRSCPFGAPRYNPVSQKAEKCSMCWQRVDEGLQPACVQACPTGALKLVDLATFDEPGAIQYPPGFPERPDINPSIRFKLPKQPVVVRRSV
jgi:Fe-S-cluster-containing dehydrogenase component